MNKKESVNVETLNVISNVITAFCMFVICIGLLAGGTWTVNTVDGLRSDYHPDKIGTMIDQISDTVDTLHSTTKMLKNSPKDFNPYEEFSDFSQTLRLLVDSLEQVPLVVNEAKSWRNMSSSGLDHLKILVENW
tara:strand:+ start:90 stop:491 length:402 start_codon:yes stop_codon:yes gene_type:complete